MFERTSAKCRGHELYAGQRLRAPATRNGDCTDCGAVTNAAAEPGLACGADLGLRALLRSRLRRADALLPAFPSEVSPRVFAGSDSALTMTSSPPIGAERRRSNRPRFRRLRRRRSADDDCACSVRWRADSASRHSSRPCRSSSTRGGAATELPIFMHSSQPGGGRWMDFGVASVTCLQACEKSIGRRRAWCPPRVVTEPTAQKSRTASGSALVRVAPVRCFVLGSLGVSDAEGWDGVCRGA